MPMQIAQSLFQTVAEPPVPLSGKRAALLRALTRLDYAKGLHRGVLGDVSSWLQSHGTDRKGGLGRRQLATCWKPMGFCGTAAVSKVPTYHLQTAPRRAEPEFPKKKHNQRFGTNPSLVVAQAAENASLQDGLERPGMCIRWRVGWLGSERETATC